MINETTIIPYTNNWKQTKLPKQNNHYYNDFKSEFEQSLYYHLDMVLQDGGNVEEELDKMIQKYKGQNIDRDKVYDDFLKKYCWKTRDMMGTYMCLPSSEFTGVTFENSPRQVELNYVMNGL